MSPAQLATVRVLQYVLDLSYRQAAEAVRCRIDFKYALGLELGRPRFPSQRAERFRDRLTRLRDLTRLELITEAVRDALEELARIAPHLLAGLVDEEWGRRYGRPLRLDKTQLGPSPRSSPSARTLAKLLEHLKEHGPDYLSGPQVQVLRQIVLQNYCRGEKGGLRWRTDDDGGLPPSFVAIVSPYDTQARYARVERRSPGSSVTISR
ncbi:transposase [Nocardia sp. NPDC051929]|uniref:transposase n=1 Tax=unclassified Nocardia TaxID=2637762 RepID=UPI00344096FA